jgi:hypothetical protein
MRRCCHARAAVGLQWARATVGYCGAISDTVVCRDAARRRQRLACRADIEVAPLVEGEVEARKGAVLAFAHVPHQYVRRDRLLLHQPAEEAAGTVGRVGNQPLRLESKRPFGAVDHHRRRGDLVEGACGRSLDIDYHGMLDVDQIVEAVTELHALFGLGGPGGGWI